MARILLHDRVVALRERLAGFQVAPPRTRTERAVHDAWKIALERRVRRIRKRAERMVDTRSWEFDELRAPVRLRPPFWIVAGREIAALHAELTGALTQHEHVRVFWRPSSRFGAVRGANTTVATSKTKARVKEAEKKALESARRAELKDAKRILDDAVDRLEATRTALRETLLELQHLAASLQQAEEARLAERIRALGDGTPDRERAEDLLLDLAQGRLNADRFREARSSGYGALLRRQWMQPRARLVRLLDAP